MKSTIHLPENLKPSSARPYSWVAAFITAIITLVISSGTAYAGLFSFMGSLLEGTPASAKIMSDEALPNSQTITLLQAAVNTDPNPNKPGDVVPIADNTLIPDIAASNDGADEPVNTAVSTYVVRQGDSISGIAHMFGVSVNTVLWANNITSKTALQAGQTLVILPISGISYTIKKGDTIQSIAKKYRADVGDILSYNDLQESDPLISGLAIIIPNGEIQVVVPTRIVYRTGSNPAHDTNGPSYPGYYMRPISGGIETQGLHGYNAVDLADRVGTPIFASAAGTVIVSKTGGWNGGYGNFIIISHDNGTQTLYAHASRNLVRVGDYVSQGQKIALMGATGEATGPHVHFEIRGAKNPF